MCVCLSVCVGLLDIPSLDNIENFATPGKSKLWYLLLLQDYRHADVPLQSGANETALSVRTVHCSGVATTGALWAPAPVKFLRLRHLLGVPGVLDFLLSTASSIVFQ